MQARYALVMVLVVLFAAANAWGDNIPLLNAPEGYPDGGGDSPLTPYYSVMGHHGIAYAVSPAGETGVLILSDVPGDATIKKAFFVTGIWDYPSVIRSSSMDFTFSGSSYGEVYAQVIDVHDAELLDLGGYIVDVTNQVGGNGTYSYVATPNQDGTGLFGSLLLVVYEHDSRVPNEVRINFGAESLQEGVSTTTFSGITIGTGTVHIFTEADQEPGSGGEESIKFNGTVIEGGLAANIFNGNQGEDTSYFVLPVNTVSGENTVTVTTGEDWIGWHVVALISPTPTSAAETTTWGRIKRMLLGR